MHVKQGDRVIIISGNEKGEQGEILAIDPEKRRVKVTNRNLIIKHQKPSPLTGESGTRVERENWIDSSNVLLYSEELGRGVRTAKRFVGNGGELFERYIDAASSYGDEPPTRIRKVRFCAKSGETFDSLS